VHLRRRVRLQALGLAVVAASCNKPSGPAGASPAPAVSARVATSAHAPTTPPLAGERVSVPVGKLVAGSVPGEPGRDPQLEPRAYDVELGPFQIDRLFYPNDPGAAPLTGVSREDARKRCAERGARLCTELEWERACKGPDNVDYPGSSAWDARCVSPASCASGFEVLGMGSLPEWVASDVIPSEPTAKRRAVLRGASPAEPAHDHRCARRRALDEDDDAPRDVGFRCCKGPPNAAVVREPALGATFVKANLPAARIEKLLAENRETAPLAHDVKLFREPEAADTVVSRGSGDKKGFSFTVLPLIWNPVKGSEILLVTARSGQDSSFVAAYHVLGKDRYRLASTFVMKNEPGPVAFAYDEYIRPRLHFSTCWGCPGETGKILLRPPDDPIILQP